MTTATHPARAPRPRLSPLAAAIMCLSAVAPVAASAMSSLSEEELSFVDAQDGLENRLVNTSQIYVNQLLLESDVGSATNVGGLRADGMRLAPSGVLGDPTAIGITWSLDAGATAANGVLPGIDFTMNMDRVRIGGAAANNGYIARAKGDTTRSYGQWALVSDLNFQAAGMPFYGEPSTTSLHLILNDATLFYRQNDSTHASVAFDNFNFHWSDPTATADIDADGLRLASAVGGLPAYFAIGFDAKYKYSGTQDMTTISAADRPLIRFSWGGDLYDATLYLRSGGLWNTAVDSGTNVAFNAGATGLVNKPVSGLSQGINVGMRWNYRNTLGANTYLLGLGHIGGDDEYVEFGDWKNLEQADGPVPGRFGFDFPLIVIDALDAGSATNAGGSLCWGNTMTGAACSVGGGSLIALRAGTVEGYNSGQVNRAGGATAVHLIRNGQLPAWSNAIRIKRNPAAPVTEVDKQWGLIYTFGNINANTYVYPGGSESDPGGGSRFDGVLVDTLFMTQSFGTWQNNYVPGPYTNTTRWSHGTHFLLADVSPGAQMGIGFLGSSFMVGADDMRIWLKDTTNGQAYPFNYEGGLDIFSPRTRANMITLFGGARLPNGRDLVRGAYIDMNLEGLWNFRLSPPHTLASDDETNDYLAWSAALRLRCGSASSFGCTDNAFANSTGSNIASGLGSYLSIAEPAFPAVDIRFADLNGDIAWTQGVLQLRSMNDTDADIAPGSPTRNLGKAATAAAAPDLVLASKLLIGASAASRLTDAVTGTTVGSGGAAGRALTTNITFGGNSMWSIAIPAGSLYSSFTLMPQ